ncbi:hypothetical protein [Cohnella sp. GCM10012308]|uniref:hypothetical protein n=1 Tax=Cohnella sp. GCM10012308 TaxID=3317329 RepID=UPI00361974C7
MEIYTPSKRWIIIGLFLLGVDVAILMQMNNFLDMFALFSTTIAAVGFILLGLGKLSYVELSNDYLVYHRLFSIKVEKWRIEEILLIRTKKRRGNTVYIYNGTDCIILPSYSDQFLTHLVRNAKHASLSHDE